MMNSITNPLWHKLLNLKPSNLKSFRALTLGLVVAVSWLVGCGGSPAKSTAPSPPLTELERDLKAVRGPLILNIFIIARADNNPLTKDDIAFINKNKPLDTIETRLTDDGRKVIFGMNIEFPADQLQALQTRFTVTRDTGN